jgi:serine protease
VAVRRLVLSVVAVSALGLSALPMTASAEDAPAPARGAVDDRSAVVPDQPDPIARGIIVQTTTSTPSDAALDATDDALGSEANVADDKKLTGKISTIVFDETVPAEVAADAAAEIQKRSDVLWAAPDTLRQIDADPPVTKNDSYFAGQRNIWDSRVASPKGGYSIKAPALWRRTEGSPDVTVAVLDTGIRAEHPDIAGKLVPGYDMISPDSASGTKRFATAGDGSGRDANPSDPGDWNSYGQCYPRSPSSPSSWHGTFVAGQIAANTDNAAGIAAVAPGVKVQPVRVLGHCGGWDSDILAGITWASGGHVDGVPDNPTPAKVVNLSLGADYGTTTARNQACVPYAAAASAGRARGSMFVASAGNGWGSANQTVPSSCLGFISVGATSSKGNRALYSNYGGAVDISAPGGDTLVEGRYDSIISLGNSGTKGASTSKYVRYEGTSMAAPQVSAAAALLFSLGLQDPGEVTTALYGSVSPFKKPTQTYLKKRVMINGRAYYFNLLCSTKKCGRGILDLSKVRAPLTPIAISGRMRDGKAIIGEPLTVEGEWVGGEPTFEWSARYPDGGYTVVGTGRRFTPGESESNKIIKVVARLGTAFEPLETSAEVTALPAGTRMTMSRPDHALTIGESFTTTVKLSSYSSQVADGVVEILVGDKVVASGTTVNRVVDIEIPGDAWTVGSNDIRAAYLGAGASDPRTISGNEYVYKRPATISASLPATTSSTSRAALKVVVTTPDGSVPEGWFRVRVDGTEVATPYLLISDNGAKTISLPLLAKGTHTIQVAFGGEFYAGDTWAPPMTIISK